MVATGFAPNKHEVSPGRENRDKPAEHVVNGIDPWLTFRVSLRNRGDARLPIWQDEKESSRL